MARVIFLRLDPRSSAQLGPLLMADGHDIHVERESAPIGVVRGSSAVFIGGVADSYLPVLRRLRALDPKLCLVVIARVPDTQSWLDAIEAGATDYWPAPFEASQVRALIEPAMKPGDYPRAAVVFRTGRVGQKISEVVSQDIFRKFLTGPGTRFTGFAQTAEALWVSVF